MVLHLIMVKNKKQYGGIGIYYYNEKNNVDYNHKEISRSLNSDNKITNNIAELKAVIFLIENIIQNYNNQLIKIYSDSEYVIKSITIWAKQWRKK